MNDEIINVMANELNINKNKVISTLKLLEEGCTIPFIARYRKEVTGNLDEEQIRKIEEVYQYQVNLLKRKEEVIRLIDEKGMFTDDIGKAVMGCQKLVEIEDIYRPFKEKKKTKATEAINNGLEPLAKIMMSFPRSINVASFLNDKVKSEDEALIGAKYIISEWISDNASYRKWIRFETYNNGIVRTSLKKGADNDVYKMYYDYSEAVKYIKPHRILAINRGEKEKILNVSIDIGEENIINYINKKIIKDDGSVVTLLVKEAIADGYKRLIKPSIEREIRAELTEKASLQSVKVFGSNLEKLLLQPPFKDKIVLGFDPAYRTGCKLAVIDGASRVLEITVIYPHAPVNKWEESKEKLKSLISKYHVDIVSIGNGTASNESEILVAEVIKEMSNDTKYMITNEAGASVYSASKLAISEFPDLHVEERSAISIARRIQDPLSELVKIDPKSIGVGLYQHDISESMLDSSLTGVVEKAVNLVGVNINTASKSILKYISGLNKTAIDKLVNYREKIGKISSRLELKKVLSPKAYEQAIGFIRVVPTENVLDITKIHPESYDKTMELLAYLDCDLDEIGSDSLALKLEKINISKYLEEHDVDKYTLELIITCLKEPNRDYRDSYEAPFLRDKILKLEDMRVGMKLRGTVRNVIDFGVFIDVGLKNDGLAHISKLTKDYIKHPLDILSVGDIVDCYIEEIDMDKKRVSLTLLH